MSATIHEAAAHLQQSILAPPGTVNTLAFEDNAGPLIRVFIEPSHWGRISPLPDRFEGFRVSVELKGKVELYKF
jgi:hypothetical protein